MRLKRSVLIKFLKHDSSTFSEEALDMIIEYIDSFEESIDENGESIEWDSKRLSECYRETAISTIVREIDPVLLENNFREAIETFLGEKTIFIGFTDRDTVVYRNY